MNKTSVIFGTGSGVYLEKTPKNEQAVVLLSSGTVGCAEQESKVATELVAKTKFSVLLVHRKDKCSCQKVTEYAEWSKAQDQDKLLQDAQSAVAFLRQAGVTCVGAIGFGVGADLLLSWAVHVHKLFDAAVVVSPTTALPIEVAEILATPLMFVFGEKGEVQSREDVLKLRDDLEKAPVPSQVCVVGDHGSSLLQLKGDEAQLSKDAQTLMCTWLTAHLAPSVCEWDVERMFPCPPVEEDWWPGGYTRAFHNRGLYLWDFCRDKWQICRQPRPAPPPPLPYDVVVEGLSGMRRTFELPGRMSLPDIVQTLNDIWDSESSGV